MNKWTWKIKRATGSPGPPGKTAVEPVVCVCVLGAVFPLAEVTHSTETFAV